MRYRAIRSEPHPWPPDSSPSDVVGAGRVIVMTEMRQINRKTPTVSNKWIQPGASSANVPIPHTISMTMATSSPRSMKGVREEGMTQAVVSAGNAPVGIAVRTADQNGAERRSSDDVCDSIVIDGVDSGTYIALHDRGSRAQSAAMPSVSTVTAEQDLTRHTMMWGEEA